MNEQMYVHECAVYDSHNNIINCLSGAVRSILGLLAVGVFRQSIRRLSPIPK
jgi:hypothetical protein